MKSKKYYNIYGTIPKYNRKKSQKEVNLYPYTHFHNLSLFWLGTGFSIKSGGLKVSVFVQTSPLSKKKKYKKELNSCKPGMI